VLNTGTARQYPVTRKDVRALSAIADSREQHMRGV
jgi:hypothetical protein